jgi:hypothetical protein
VSVYVIEPESHIVPEFDARQHAEARLFADP